MVPQKRESRKILTRSRNLGIVFEGSRSLVFVVSSFRSEFLEVRSLALKVRKDT